ncbi:MAG: hypothetical protein N2Z80_02960 [Hydrogenothermaceae bacterium]|nr:hypothetical protein [Hydrogenothermaceae bacterium]
MPYVNVKVVRKLIKEQKEKIVQGISKLLRKTGEKGENFYVTLKTLLLAFPLIFLLSSCGGSSESQTVPKQTTPKAVLIPLYPHPNSYREEYEKVLSLNSKVDILLVVNPSNGPGSNKDESFSQVVDKLKEKGFLVFGYIYSSYGKRDISQLRSEMDKYTQFYPKLDGFFIDEVSNSLSIFGYYSQVYTYGKSLGKRIILNPGTTVPEEFYQVSDMVVIFERDSNFLLQGYNIPSRVSDRDCLLVYGVDTQEKALYTKDYLLKRGFSCFYIIDENPPTWFKLSPYIGNLIAD